MQIVIGIDHEGDRTVSNLVKRLRFREANYDLTYVIPPAAMGFAGGSGSGGAVPPEAVLMYDDIRAFERQQKEQGKQSLLCALESFKSEEGTAVTSLLEGHPTEILLARADDTRADLIAVNAAHVGPLLAFLTGSVARGLVIGAEQSVLLARHCTRGGDGATNPVRAVLATDFSPYMDQCIDQFLRFRPRGLEHLTILTASPEYKTKGREPYHSQLGITPSEAMCQVLEQRNLALVRRLQDAFYPFPITITSKVSSEPIDRAITDAMEETAADLLIVGAQGHSFLERLTLGSVSFKQAMTAPYSVLVLRVGSQERADLRTTTKTQAA